MTSVSNCKEARTEMESVRDRFEYIRKSIRSALEKEAHGWVWALEQMTANMETESSLSSDVKEWKKVIEAYDALFELVWLRTLSEALT